MLVGIERYEEHSPFPAAEGRCAMLRTWLAG